MPLLLSKRSQPHPLREMQLNRRPRLQVGSKDPEKPDDRLETEILISAFEGFADVCVNPKKLNPLFGPYVYKLKAAHPTPRCLLTDSLRSVWSFGAKTIGQTLEGSVPNNYATFGAPLSSDNGVIFLSVRQPVQIEAFISGLQIPAN